MLGECEMSFVHHLLSRVPDDFPNYVEDLVSSAHSLFRKYPPEKLAGAVEQYIKQRYVSQKKQSVEKGSEWRDNIYIPNNMQMVIGLRVSRVFKSTVSTI